MVELQIDTEFQNLIPNLFAEELHGLENSIKESGCRVPLDVWGDIIVDGHNRYNICVTHGIDFEVNQIEFANRVDAKIWIIRNQFDRRNLQLYQRGSLALVLEPLIAEKAKEQQVVAGKQHGRGQEKLCQNSDKAIEPIDTKKEIAKVAGVSHDTISRIKKIKDKGTDEQKAKLESGEFSVNQVYTAIKTKEKRAERVEAIIHDTTLALEDSGLGKHAVILADPPWRYEHSKSDSRKIENQYPTMTLEDIKNLDIDSVVNDPGVLFLWATSPKLVEALEVMAAWGFNYRTCMCWVKDRIGMGFYARQRHELLLIGIKGDMITPEPPDRPDSVIESPREEHSKKPDVVYDLIETMYPELPKLEIFARTERGGWSSWGNQVE